MFWNIFTFELNYRMRRIATWAYFLLFFIFIFLAFASGNTPAREKVLHDGPHNLMLTNIFFSMVMILTASAVMGVPMYRDLEHGTRNWLFSYPLKERDYFWGRFWGSFVVVLFIGSAIVLGSFLGSKMAPFFGMESPERYGNFGFFHYLKPFLLYAVPNLMICSAIFFALVALTKNQKVLYASGMLLFVFYLLTAVLMQDLENQKILQWTDIFALNLSNYITKYWTPFEKNTLMMPYAGEFLVNRILFLGLAWAMLLFAFFKFKFSTFAIPLSRKRKVKNEENEVLLKTAPIVQVDFDKKNSRRNFWNLAKIEFLNVYRDNYFRVILLGAVIFLIIDFYAGFTNQGVKSRPITTDLLALKNWDYTLFMYIILIFFSGEAIHREKTYKFNIINDALPVSNRSLIFSKFVGISGIALLLCLVPIVVGVLYQTLKGHFDYQLGRWFAEMVIITFPNLMVLMLLAFFIHLLVNNKWAAHGITVSVFLLMWVLRAFAEMDFNLLFYSYMPDYKWSDMNGIGHFVQPIFWFTSYWLLLGLLLLLIGTLFFVRGIPGSFKERLKIAGSRFNGKLKLMSVALLLGFLGIGAYIYHNTNFVNHYMTVAEGRMQKAEYEKVLKKYEFIAQPRIVGVDMTTDIYPKDRRMLSKAIWTVYNRSGVPIDSLHISYSDNVDFDLKFNGEKLSYTYPLQFEHSKLTFFRKGKKPYPYRIYRLSKQMMPGDSAIVEINSDYHFKGFVNKGFGRELVYNGTFTAPQISIGYARGDELDSDNYRKKYGLNKKEVDWPAVTDSVAVNTAYFTPNQDYVKFNAVVSTTDDQIAIAPGYVNKTWKKDGRIYYHFVQDQPILDFYTFVSADFEVRTEKIMAAGKPVNLEVYYHKGHDYNIDRILAAYSDGIKLFSEWYGPFQFRQMRAIEFPNYAGFAQSFTNTVPITEGGGWLSDFSNPNSFDYLYWLTAHELAHQWFGHQVTPSRTQGANMISESLAEFTALQLTEEKYGKDNMKRFLREELDNYLMGRSSEARFERTLIDANAPYVWYQKGSLALYGHEDLIGRPAMVKAIRAFRDEFEPRKGPPYATSHDLYRHIEANTPPQYRYFLEDSWKKIVLYENRAISAAAKDMGNGEYEVTLKFSASKLQVDKEGKEHKAAMSDFIDIGIFASETKDKNGRRKTNPLYLKKHQLKAGEQTVKIKVKGKPVKAGIDPYNKLIDRIPDDNTLDF